MSAEAYFHSRRDVALGVLRSHAVVCTVQQMGNGVDRVSGAGLVPLGAGLRGAASVDLSCDARLLDCVSVALSALGLAAAIGADYLAQCCVRPVCAGVIEVTAVLTECRVDMLLAG